MYYQVPPTYRQHGRASGCTWQEPIERKDESLLAFAMLHGIQAVGSRNGTLGRWGTRLHANQKFTASTCDSKCKHEGLFKASTALGAKLTQSIGKRDNQATPVFLNHPDIVVLLSACRRF